MNYCRTITCLILIATFVISCVPPIDTEYVILLKNQSNHRIDSYLGANKHFPDTTIVETNFRWSVEPEKSIGFSSTTRWEKIFEEYVPSDTLSMFVFHTDTLEANLWETIIDEYKVLKRYDLSIEDIQLLNYDIPYPPTERMKDMQMYPPYEE